jgi:type II secretory pathway component PulJ
MTPLPRLVDDLANALQSAVLLVEHLERTTATIGRDLTALGIALKRATDTLLKLHGGDR